MSTSIISPKAFDISNLTLGGTKDLSNGGKTVYIAYKGDPLRVQTPEMVLPFGLTAWPKPDVGPPEKFSIEPSFSNMESRPPIARFHNMLKAMDQRLLEEGMAHSPAWFKRQHKSLDVTEAVYTPIVKARRDNAYPPVFKVSIPFYDGEIKCDIFDDQRNRINLLEHELKGAKVTAIIQCTGIWLAAGKFGCSWKAVQLRIVPRASIKGYAFQDNPEDRIDAEEDMEEDEEDAAPVSGAGAGAKRAAAVPPPPPPGTNTNSMLVESDEEEDGEEDEAPAPAPPAAPEPAKKTVNYDLSDDEVEIAVPPPRASKSRK